MTVKYCSDVTPDGEDWCCRSCHRDEEEGHTRHGEMLVGPFVSQESAEKFMERFGKRHADVQMEVLDLTPSRYANEDWEQHP